MNSHIINEAILAKEVILINDRYIGKIVGKVLNGKGLIVKLLFDNDYVDKIIVQYNLLPPLQQRGHMLITKDDNVKNIDYNAFKRVLKGCIKTVNIATTRNRINDMVGGLLTDSKIQLYQESSKGNTDFVQFDKEYQKTVRNMFRTDEKVFEKLFPKDLSPNEAIAEKISLGSSRMVLDDEAIVQLKGIFTKALKTYQTPEQTKDFDDYRFRLAMTQLVLTDKDLELLGEGIADTIRERLINLQRIMTLSDGTTPIYPSVNLFSFLIYVKNNNGYCEFKNKYAGRMARTSANSEPNVNPVVQERINVIKRELIKLRTEPRTDPAYIKKLEGDIRAIKQDQFIFEKVLGPSAIPNNNTLVKPYEPIGYNYLYYILTDPTVDKNIKEQALELLAQDYVICLQPHPSYVVWCFQRLLLAWYSDSELTKMIHKVCILINFKRAEPVGGNKVGEDYGVMPVILIVPKYGETGLGSSRDIAFNILRILNDCFFSYNDVAWAGSYPTYFKSISPLIWYAHGDGVYNALKRKHDYCNDGSGSMHIPSLIEANIEPTFLFESLQTDKQNVELCITDTDTEEIKAMQKRITQQIQEIGNKQEIFLNARQQQQQQEEALRQQPQEALGQQQQPQEALTQQGGNRYYIRKI